MSGAESDHGFWLAREALSAANVRSPEPYIGKPMLGQIDGDVAWAMTEEKYGY
jgi:hypothetical protein